MKLSDREPPLISLTEEFDRSILLVSPRFQAVMDDPLFLCHRHKVLSMRQAAA
jgi:hypothetical protein